MSWGRGGIGGMAWDKQGKRFMARQIRAEEAARLRRKARLRAQHPVLAPLTAAQLAVVDEVVAEKGGPA